MVRVGVVGLGMMGNTHLGIYLNHPDAEVAAISDANPRRLSGEEEAVGNVEGQGGTGIAGIDCRRYAEARELIEDDSIDLVDICLPTPMHLSYGKAAMEAGRHVMIEKPLARTPAQADELARAAKSAKGLTMAAMTMRFWPAWVWLKERIEDQTHGRVRSAHFRRLASHPPGDFYADGEANGGGLLDLHVHDADFVQFCFGMPAQVSSVGYSKHTGEIDHVLTQYIYPDGPELVVAEGGWTMPEGFDFTMQYVVNFESAAAVFDLGAEHPLVLQKPGEPAQPIELSRGLGYDHEIDYMLKCIQEGRTPEVVTLADAARSVHLTEAERASVERGQRVEPSAAS